VLSDL